MTKIIRRQEFTVETHSVTIIRSKGVRASAFCQNCGCDVTVFSVEQIAAVLQKNTAEILNLVENGELHLAETGNTPALICGGAEDTGIQLKTVQGKSPKIF